MHLERRTLVCFGDVKTAGKYSAECKLMVGDDPKLLDTECFDEQFTEQSFGNDKSESAFSVRWFTLMIRAGDETLSPLFC
ncbi:unnamed protein product [Gongylonema pulchrum]|uniref:Uncharacterized protein n=1 Tax=Gongylonema pulchrum TaxID=637853 RepID=A0A183DPE5_9BILA|nr:unnamed protein product [Gongylonema pulchrum]